MCFKTQIPVKRKSNSEDTDSENRNRKRKEAEREITHIIDQKRSGGICCLFSFDKKEKKKRRIWFLF